MNLVFPVARSLPRKVFWRFFSHSPHTNMHLKSMFITCSKESWDSIPINDTTDVRTNKQNDPTGNSVDLN